jgi:serine/threonine protein kinase/Tol biopolymer transport system component
LPGHSLLTNESNQNQVNKDLSANTTLSHYRIVSKIGTGGMGEVYRALDTRLDREVAIKVLPTAFAQDVDRLRRFEQEARATSSLNHPNILTVHDIGTHEGAPYIVAELLEGEELRDRLNAGPLPVKRALDYAQQVAAGLAAAHEKGIVHRDLKPENLFVTKDGRVKILDFGLAKLRPQRSEPSGSDIATQKQITEAGTVMGTVGYMSPEQVRGQVADHRSDIFSFGVILYEMLTGRRAFLRESMAETMTAILKEEPEEVTEANSQVPPQLVRVVKTCLAKKPDERFQAAHDLKLQLQWIAEGGSQAELSVPGTTRHKTRERVMWASAGFAFAAIAAALLFWILAARSASPLSASKPVKRMTIKLPDTEPLALAKFGPLGIGRTSVALSPDGSLLAYAAERNGNSQLYLRALDRFDAKPISGTEGAYNPFFSPDGRSLGFFSENKLKRVSLQGGEPVTLCEARIPHGASWGPDDTIVFADSEGVNLSRVSASGGRKEVLSKSEDRSFYPEILPGGKAVLFSTKGFYNPDYGQIAVLSLATGERRVVLEGGTNPRYAASGNIVFARAGAILAAPFDLSRLEVTGPAVTLVEGIRIEEWGAAQFALSPEGTLVYASGGPAWIGKLTWVDHQGISKPLVAPAKAYGPVSLSPDGQRLTVSIAGGSSDVWVYEFTRGTFTRLTMEGSNDQPLWTPDGRRIVYSRSSGPNQFQMVWELADGSGAEEVLTTSKHPTWAGSWSPDAKLLAFNENTDTGVDLWILPLEGDRQPYPWLKTKFNEMMPAFSRDGKWIAYISDESGQFEIYVQSFPGPGGKRQISTAGGEEVRWSPDGRTLFYRDGLKWMSVAVQTQPEFRAEAPKVMFEGPFLNVPGVSYDVAPDGQHFIMIEENQKQAPTTQLNVVLNWLEELKR